MSEPKPDVPTGASNLEQDMRTRSGEPVDTDTNDIPTADANGDSDDEREDENQAVPDPASKLPCMEPGGWEAETGASSSGLTSVIVEMGHCQIAPNIKVQRISAAARKELRAQDAAQAMREHETHRLAVLAKTARLRAARLAREAKACGLSKKT